MNLIFAFVMPSLPLAHSLGRHREQTQPLACGQGSIAKATISAVRPIALRKIISRLGVRRSLSCLSCEALVI
jgi:hypothetical protein